MQRRIAAFNLLYRLIKLDHIGHDNPIRGTVSHEVTESEPHLAVRALTVLNQFIAQAEADGIRSLDPIDGLTILFDRMRMQFPEYEGSPKLFTDMLSVKRKATMDYYGSAMFLMAVAHEFGWSVQLVSLPDHIYFKVTGSEGVINFDPFCGTVIDNEGYQILMNVDGVYIANNTLNASTMMSVVIARRGQVHEVNGDTESAIADFQRGLIINPHDHGIRKHLANTFMTQGKLAEAAAILRQFRDVTDKDLADLQAEADAAMAKMNIPETAEEAERRIEAMRPLAETVREFSGKIPESDVNTQAA